MSDSIKNKLEDGEFRKKFEGDMASFADALWEDMATIESNDDLNAFTNSAVQDFNAKYEKESKIGGLIATKKPMEKSSVKLTEIEKSYEKELENLKKDVQGQVTGQKQEEAAPPVDAKEGALYLSAIAALSATAALTLY